MNLEYAISFQTSGNDGAFKFFDFIGNAISFSIN